MPQIAFVFRGATAVSDFRLDPPAWQVAHFGAIIRLAARWAAGQPARCADTVKAQLQEVHQ